MTSGEVWGTSGKFGELPGKFGELPGNLWIAVKFHSERTSGEVAGKLPGKLGELLGKSGDFPEARGSLTPSQRLAKFVPKHWMAEPLTSTRRAAAKPNKILEQRRGRNLNCRDLWLRPSLATSSCSNKGMHKSYNGRQRSNGSGQGTPQKAKLKWILMATGRAVMLRHAGAQQTSLNK